MTNPLGKTVDTLELQVHDWMKRREAKLMWLVHTKTVSDSGWHRVEGVKMTVVRYFTSRRGQHD